MSEDKKIEEMVEKLVEEKMKEKKDEMKEEVRKEVEEEQKEQNKPLLPPKKRNLHYKFSPDSNPNWKGQEDVWLKETEAISFHNELIRRGAEYMGDQNGNMTPPRDFRAAYYNAHGEIIGQKKRQHG